jgi:hypothetical protein
MFKQDAFAVVYFSIDLADVSLLATGVDDLPISVT